ncbi:MAG: PilZ domain-containing protein [Gammaproteobacteria bacterium]|nr:PilZ domain-containing protein [Gammaproteobacteria bacterium]
MTKNASDSNSKNEIENEKRHYFRVNFFRNAYVSFGGQNFECHLLDISLKGVLIEPPKDIEMKLGGLYTFYLVLSKEVTITMQSKVIHSEDNHIGLQWIDIDLDSITELRRLLEYNSNDPEEIYRELADLFIKQE